MDFVYNEFHIYWHKMVKLQSKGLEIGMGCENPASRRYRKCRFCTSLTTAALGFTKPNLKKLSFWFAACQAHSTAFLFYKYKALLRLLPTAHQIKCPPGLSSLSILWWATILVGDGWEPHRSSSSGRGVDADELLI